MADNRNRPAAVPNTPQPAARPQQPHHAPEEEQHAEPKAKAGGEGFSASYNAMCCRLCDQLAEGFGDLLAATFGLSPGTVGDVLRKASEKFTDN